MELFQGEHFSQSTSFNESFASGRGEFPEASAGKAMQS